MSLFQTTAKVALVLQAKNAGAVLQDDVIINFLLNSLPNDYEKIKEDILDNTDNIPVSLDKVKDKLRAKFNRLKSRIVTSSENQALRVRNQRGNFRTENFSNINRNCFKCGGRGHIARVCPSGNFFNEQNHRSISSNNQTNTLSSQVNTSHTVAMCHTKSTYA